MEYDHSFVETQKKALLAEKERVESEISTLKERPDYGIGDEDDAQEVVDFENNLSVDSEMEVVLQKIEDALAAIENGTYGQCSQCNQAIEKEHLAITPWADICVKCNKENKKNA